MCGLTTDAVAQAFLIPPATLAQRVVRAKPRIVNLYEALLRLSPSPVIELNRAAAIALRDDPAAGLVLIDAILARDLRDYRFAHAADAREAYERALALTNQEPERRFLERRIGELAQGA